LLGACGFKKARPQVWQIGLTPYNKERMPALSDVKLGIVCPMANEGKAGTEFVRAVLEQCEGFREVVFFAVLDQVTRDNSVLLLHELERTEPRLKVVWAPENRCVVDAYVRGYEEALGAGADWILEIDAGFSHQPREIPQFFQAMQRGYDCVFGSRFMPGGGFHGSRKRYLISRGGSVLANLALGTKQTDMTSGFELFSRAALAMAMKRGIQSRGNFFQTEIKTYCRHLRFVEVPIHYDAHNPKLAGSVVTDSFRHLWRLFGLRCTGRL
jgi:dolichol-phosphate mannosyltransferase